ARALDTSAETPPLVEKQQLAVELLVIVGFGSSKGRCCGGGGEAVLSDGVGWPADRGRLPAAPACCSLAWKLGGALCSGPGSAHGVGNARFGSSEGTDDAGPSDMVG
ncbi:MAG: hypothetical protein LC808_17765, partial [Actinobacteria bacterium]|nr:hypothetical protein [Actinomycetota bacterium]